MRWDVVRVLDRRGNELVGARVEVMQDPMRASSIVYITLPPEYDLDAFKLWQAEVRSAPSIDHVMYNWHREVS